MPVDFQAADEYNKYQWRIAGVHSSTYIIYIELTSFDIKLSVSKKNRIISTMNGQFQSGLPIF